MNSDSPTQKKAFTWWYRHAVDEKRRLQIPVQWRPENKQGFALTILAWPKNTQGVCLKVLPPEAMESLMQKLDNLPDSDSSKPKAKRLIHSNSIQVELDSSGRVCIPPELLDAAGIVKDTLMVGTGETFEIWNPERGAKCVKDTNDSAAETLKNIEI